MESSRNPSTQNNLKFPITKPQICSNNPQFPYRDVRHYTNPCCDFAKKCQIGYAAQQSLEQHQQHQNTSSTGSCHSPDLPTSHPWFEPS
jgi:hypothetical protein